MSRLVGKPTICIGENKDADQLRGNREADQRLCFRYSDSTIPLLLKSEISSFQLFPVLVQAGLCRTCSATTLLVFPRGGSYIKKLQFLNLGSIGNIYWYVIKCKVQKSCIELSFKAVLMQCFSWRNLQKLFFNYYLIFKSELLIRDQNVIELF